MVLRRPQDWLATKVDWLHEYRDKHLVEQVHYVQDGVAYDMWATPLSASDELDDETVLIESQYQDFMITREQFKTLGVADPERGDAIIRNLPGSHGEKIEYQVIGRGAEPGARMTSRYRKAFRIHTVLLQTEDSVSFLPDISEVKWSTSLGNYSAGFRTSPAVIEFTTVGPTVSIG